MNTEVTYSAPKVCKRCEAMIRIMYIDGVFWSIKEADPHCEATKKNPNPIYLTHKCKEI